MHALLPGSPAIDAADGTQWNYLPKVKGALVSNLLLDFQHAGTLPPVPFQVMSSSEIRTVLKLTDNRALLNEPFGFLPTNFELAVLSDGRGVPRLFSPVNVDTSTNGMSSSMAIGTFALPGMDIGAIEAVPILTMTSSATSGSENS